MNSSFILRIGGEAGWGLATAAQIFAKVCVKQGLHIFASKEYASQIKKGHNYHNVRASANPINADVDTVDILLALNKETVDLHLGKVADNGFILISDKMDIGEKVSVGEKVIDDDKRFVVVPLTKIENELGEKNIRNAVFLGATIKCLGIEFNLLNEVMEEHFQKKPDLKRLLLKAAKAGHDAVEDIKNIKADFIRKIIDNVTGHVAAEITDKGKLPAQTILNGNTAISLGALKAGLTFHAQYPMTPVSGILHYLAKEAVKNKSLTVVQPEDEIAAINFALGASYAGVRAMTATSGGGFSLMVESLGLSGMAEIPLVLIEGQRPGPATGLPTKNEQGDLKFVLSAAQGDFPRVVIAPGNIEECYTETKRAFHLAEKYQVPVIVLVDKHLTESFKTTNLGEEEQKFNFDSSKRIGIITKISQNQLNKDKLFQRYSEKESTRAIPGTPNGIYTCSGDEHNEVGYITEDPELRNKMMNRRMNKRVQIKKELPIPCLIGPDNANLTVVSWGSNNGAIKEAIEMFNLEGKRINFLCVKYMCPFQEEIKELLEKTKNLILIENNYSAQLGSLIREKTGIEIKDKILRSDGRPFTVDEIYNKLKGML